MTHYLLLKTFFFNIYLILTNPNLYLLLSLIVISNTFLFATLRVKFLLFIILVILFSVWGFLFNLDGMMLVMLTAEFTIVLFFFMTYLQLYSNFNFVTKFKNNYVKLLPIVLIFFLFNFSSVTLTSVNLYNSLYHLVSSDFFILYYLLFNKLSILVIIITLIISLFSLFFIVLYFNLKLIKLGSKSKNKQLFFLRKQSLIKQTNFKNYLYTFQK